MYVKLTKLASGRTSLHINQMSKSELRRLYRILNFAAHGEVWDGELTRALATTVVAGLDLKLGLGKWEAKPL